MLRIGLGLDLGLKAKMFGLGLAAHGLGLDQAPKAKAMALYFVACGPVNITASV